ncbi:MAG TPA: hypothetical protein VMU93_09345 [Caulobacteraceae bacterium]|nr:hypothetical protein [Caulobacteraceae bacterium]
MDICGNTTFQNATSFAVHGIWLAERKVASAAFSLALADSIGGFGRDGDFRRWEEFKLYHCCILRRFCAPCSDKPGNRPDRASPEEGKNVAAPISLADAVSRFGASAKAKLDNPAATGEPEDQLRAPLEALVLAIGAMTGLAALDAVLVGETALSDLMTPGQMPSPRRRGTSRPRSFRPKPSSTPQPPCCSCDVWSEPREFRGLSARRRGMSRPMLK